MTPDVIWRPREMLARVWFAASLGLIGGATAVIVGGSLALGPIAYLAVAWIAELLLERSRRTLWPEQRALFWLDMHQPDFEKTADPSQYSDDDSELDQARRLVSEALKRGGNAPISQWRAAAEREPNADRRRYNLISIAFIDAAVERASGRNPRAVPKLSNEAATTVELPPRRKAVLWAVRLANLGSHLVAALAFVVFGLLFLRPE